MLRKCRKSAIAVGILAWATSQAAFAQISFVDMFRNDATTQTGNGNSLNTLGSFLSMQLTSVNPGDFTSASVTYPGPGSPTSLPSVSPTLFNFQTGFFPNQAAMDAAFPFGTYQFTANPGAATASFSYTADDYPGAQPFLAGSDFSNLQGVNAHNPIDLHFSPFANDPVANFQLTFFTLFDPVANKFIFDTGALPRTSSGITLPANMLKPGHAYIYELDDSNRVLVPSPGAQLDAQLGFDRRTTGTFTTSSVPEPGALALLAGFAVSGAAFLLRRR